MEGNIRISDRENDDKGDIKRKIFAPFTLFTPYNKVTLDQRYQTLLEGYDPMVSTADARGFTPDLLF